MFWNSREDALVPELSLQEDTTHPQEVEGGRMRGVPRTCLVAWEVLVMLP